MAKTIFIVVTVLISIIIFVSLLSILKDAMTTGMSVVGCEISCSDNADCDDENSCTNDVCMYPNSCEAMCVHSLVDSCR